MLMNGRSVIPQTVVISAEGRLVSHWNGYGSQSRSRLRDAIDRALGEKASGVRPQSIVRPAENFNTKTPRSK